MSWIGTATLLPLALLAGWPLARAQESPANFFEKKIRPVLATRCYACHSSKSKSPMGGLVLDTADGLKKGGASGPVLQPGKPSASRLLQALRYADPRLQMPPSGKLKDDIIADFEQWIAGGAQDPRTGETTAAAPGKGTGPLGIADGRKWWAFQPLKTQTPPAVKQMGWVRNEIDSFVLAALESKQITPSPQADPRTLATRLSINLTGLRPTKSELDEFAADPSDEAYSRLVDRLLASKRYGERWGRYWLDVARYAEDNPTSEATNPPYPFAWRYRDWVIEAFNQDLPYDRFVQLQLAADSMPGATRGDLRALAFLGAGPVYHKDARLSREVIETIYTDDWDERVDTVTRGVLGLTVACARCHDHKFDPILTKDYYALAGVFASSMPAQRPLFDMDPKAESRFAWLQQRLFQLQYLANLMSNEPGTKPEEAAEKAARFRAEIASLKPEVDALEAQYPAAGKVLRKYYVKPAPRPKGDAGTRKREDPGSTEPFAQGVIDAGLWVDGNDADLTMLDYRPGVARDLPVFLRGSVSNPGDPAPRRFLTVLMNNPDSRFSKGSGRQDLADRLFQEAGPLAARVIVNRVWGWHFGRPLVATTSDFGTQGDKPTHPELLEDLASRFVEHGWSLKWLHREILTSSAYRQASHPRADASKADPTNALLWRMHPRRLDIEAYRDSLLRPSGELEEQLYGLPADLDKDSNHRRTIYGRVSRGRLNAILRLYDFSDPTQHSPGRELTITPLQQLFVMNSAFIQQRAQALASLVEGLSAREQVEQLYSRVLSRSPEPAEVDVGLSYLHSAGVPQYAQALLSTNEFIFWP